MTTWKFERDTLEPASDFCFNCVFVRRLGSGEEIWKCLGHDLTGNNEAPPKSDVPDSFKERPLLGRRLVESFSGVPGKEGGSALSQAWEDAGGCAVRMDIRLDANHDFNSNLGILFA